MDKTTDVSEKDVTLFPEQQAAKDKFLEWYGDPSPPQDHDNPFEPRRFLDIECEKKPGIFRIFGFAGTGKTTITKSIIKEVKGLVLSGAFTGKAALVMRRHGMSNARTIHSMVYKPITPNKIEADKLRREVDKAQIDGMEKVELKKLYADLAEAESMHFVLNEEDSPLLDAGLLVVDEVSMVNQPMADDIASFGVPLLVLGDPGQLPPIEGTGALVQDKPDILLETIHRQARDNPVIALSMKARTGQAIPYGSYGASRKITEKQVTAAELIDADQVLTGKNVTRRKLNRYIRSGVDRSGGDPYPTKDDKLICLRNNREKGIFNGLLCTVLERRKEFDTSIEYRLKTEDDKEIIVRILRAHFDEYTTPGTIKSLRWWDFQDAEEFDYGYAITVHKSQGSQWDNVLLWDDKFFNWDEMQRRKWLYTAITRAAETITIVQG